MSVAKTIEISAESTESFEHAVEHGVQKASESVENLNSVWVKDQEVLLTDDGAIDRYRVAMKATFTLN